MLVTNLLDTHVEVSGEGGLAARGRVRAVTYRGEWLILLIEDEAGCLCEWSWEEYDFKVVGRWLDVNGQTHAGVIGKSILLPRGEPSDGSDLRPTTLAVPQGVR